jgi:hypothetical protein
MHEYFYFDKKCFVTLTYDRRHLPIRGSLDKAEFTKFWKRLRKSVESRVKYFACGEYGEKFGRPHYHAIVFGLSVDDVSYFRAAWGNGHVESGTVTYESARYVADYLGKKEVGPSRYGGREPPFQVQSQGLGKRFVADNKRQLLEFGSLTLQGVRVGLPRYYRKVLGVPSGWRAEQAEIAFLSLVERHAGICGIKDVKHLSCDDRRRIYKSMEVERKQREKNLSARQQLVKKGF